MMTLLQPPEIIDRLRRHIASSYPVSQLSFPPLYNRSLIQLTLNEENISLEDVSFPETEHGIQICLLPK